MKRLKLLIGSCDKVDLLMFGALGAGVALTAFAEVGKTGLLVVALALLVSSSFVFMVRGTTSLVKITVLMREKDVTIGELLWHMRRILRPVRTKDAAVATKQQEKPEKILRLCGFLLPKYCQERYLKPALEEMKEQRILADAEAETAFQEHFIECCFFVKLAVTYLFTLLCLFRDGLTKVSPVVKWFLTGTMR